MLSLSMLHALHCNQVLRTQQRGPRTSAWALWLTASFNVVQASWNFPGRAAHCKLRGQCYYGPLGGPGGTFSHSSSHPGRRFSLRLSSLLGFLGRILGLALLAQFFVLCRFDQSIAIIFGRLLQKHPAFGNAMACEGGIFDFVCPLLLTMRSTRDCKVPSVTPASESSFLSLSLAAAARPPPRSPMEQWIVSSLMTP